MVLTDGAGFAAFAVWGLGIGPEGPDYMAVGDLSTLSEIPWMPGYARIICNGVVNRKAYPYCSRVALKAQTQRLEDRGLTMFTGIEPEFMLLARRADGTLGPADVTDDLDKPCYDYKGLYRTREALDEMVEGLRAVGIDVYQIDHEDGNGQFEINFTYADALKSADNFTFVKMAASEIAHKHGMIATFMPKPFSNRTGSGAHFHVSLGSGSQKNAFHDPNDKSGMGLSPLGVSFPRRRARARARALRHCGADRQFLQASGGGPLVIGRDVGACVHRLRRQQPHRLCAGALWPPRSAASGFGMQSVSGLRGTDRSRARRHRPQARPRTGAEPQSLRAVARELADKGIGLLPQSLAEALDALERDEVVMNGLGQGLAREFIRLKRMEWTEYSRHVSEWETRRYLEFF